jgi:hypothetical protein
MKPTSTIIATSAVWRSHLPSDDGPRNRTLPGA